MVRLKAILRAKDVGANLSQFHMVRLKACRCYGTRTAGIPFQFHMVRLKESREIISDFDSIVSIPYGTIKSPHPLRGLLFCFVSIPYGTIKSWMRTNELKDIMKFQFHMVRLKVSAAGDNFQGRGFQFHMVRLKVQV